MRTLVTFSEMLSLVETQVGNRVPRAVLATMLANAVEQIGLTQLPKAASTLYVVQENQMAIPYPDDANLIKIVGKVQYTNSEIANIINLPENANIRLPIDPICVQETPTGIVETTELSVPHSGAWYSIKPWHLNKDWAYRYGSWYDDKMNRRIVISDKIKEGDVLYLMYDSADSQATVFPRELIPVYLHYTYYMMYMVQDANKSQQNLRTCMQLLDDYKLKNMPSVGSIAAAIDRNRNFGI